MGSDTCGQLKLSLDKLGLSYRVFPTTSGGHSLVATDRSISPVETGTGTVFVLHLSDLYGCFTLRTRIAGTGNTSLP